MGTIELKHVKKSYDEGQSFVIKDFSLVIEEKEFVVFVGPSGCGKSTTLRMIAGLESITEGQLWMDGKLMNKVAAKDRDIAMVFQSYALFPHLNVFDNIAFALQINKLPKDKIKTKVEEVAQTLGLTPYMTRKPKDLSGGQQQRVALGRAIVNDSQFFLMDEPLSNLDANLRTTMRTELSLLHRNLGKTTVYVTHDQTEAMTMASKIVVMNAGEIMQIGTPTEIYDRPVNRFVADFIGSPKMNFLNAHIVNGFVQLGENQVIAKLKIARPDQAVILGIRPENMLIEASASDRTLAAEVFYTEMLGSDIHIHARLGEKKLLVRSDRHQAVEVGETVNIFLKPHHIHLFDPRTEERLPLELEAMG